MLINHHVFREYDIRGVADRDFTGMFPLELGRALGTFWKKRNITRVSVGRDCRLSSPRLYEGLVQGILETGINILDVGMVPTPMLYFSVFAEGLGGGVQITGSHNPKDDNGFKIMSGKGTLSGDEIQELKQIMLDASWTEAEPHSRGVLAHKDLSHIYLGFMRDNIKLGPRGLKFAVDAGNGAGGPLCISVMKGLGLEPHFLLCEPDGNFPVHHPDPSLPESLELLVGTIRKEGLEFGIAFDGDADRIGVVDKEGRAVFGDKLLILFAREVLKKHPGAAIMGEVKCSQTLYDDISAKGGRPILWKTGHSLIKKKMAEENALLAGEMSGHVFFKDRYYGFDDALYAALRLVEILSNTDASLESMLSDIPFTVSTPEIRVDCPDAIKFTVVDQVKEYFQNTHQVIDVDGARILFEHGWGLVRASNTQPVLVLRFEANSQENLDIIQNTVEQKVLQFQ